MAPQFVVDNSVVLAWCFENEASAYADSVLNHFEHAKAVVPAIWPLEICNVLLAAEQEMHLTPTDSTRFISLLSDLPITVEQESVPRMQGEIFSLARKQELSSYEASYLDLAMRLGLPLATVDERLRTAAGRCQVPILFE
jgi:predicted nucleic acid-binding protein